MLKSKNLGLNTAKNIIVVFKNHNKILLFSNVFSGGLARGGEGGGAYPLEFKRGQQLIPSI